MLDIVILPFWVPDIFVFPKIILELPPTPKHSQVTWKQFHPRSLAFQICYAGPEQYLVQGKWLRQGSLSPLSNALWILRFSTLPGGNGTILVRVWASGTVTSNPFHWLCAQTRVVSSRVCAVRYPVEHVSVTTGRFLEFSLCAVLSSLVFWPVNAHLPGLPVLSTSLP